MSLIGNNCFIVSKIFDKNQGNAVDIYFPYIKVSTHGHVQNIGQTLPKPFMPISRIWNISIGNTFIKIQGKSSRSQMHIVITLQSLMSIKVILVHQNAPKPSLTRIKFEQLSTTNFLSLPQLLWACSHDQMRPLHQVVHQGEVIFSTRSTQVQFC